MKNAVIICGAPGHNAEFVKAHTDENDYVIACDGGCDYAASAGIVPDLAVGDFDTAAVPENCPSIVLPGEKDCTDTMFACRKAVEMDFDAVKMLCATAGRQDHCFANYLCLDYLNSNGVDGVIVDEKHRISVCDKPFFVDNQSYKYLSLFAFGSEVCDLILTGVKYPLNKYRLTPDDSLCISNEILGDKAQVSFTHGKLLVFLSKD